jgi:hypothetical protein
MGAGENALFEIFSTIYAAGDGSLLVMDEVELGLHAEAQKKFMEKLKEVCLEMHTQVICTTHSKEIFDCLPNDARFYVESVGGKTRVTQGVSSDFAFAKMSAITGNELDIYVEDDVARSILLAALPSHLRTRISIKVIGSATAIARQLAALYVRKDKKPTLAVFDADQRGKEADNLAHAAKMAETPKPDFQQWIKERISYLPGDTWPEAWLIEKGEEAVDALAAAFGTDPSELMDILEYGRQAGKHDEFFEIAKNVGLDQTPCLQLFTTVVCQHCASDFLSLSKTIETTLSKNG